MKLSATYVRDGDKILAFHGDRLIAHGTKFAEVEKTAVDYLDSLRSKENADIVEKERSSATHVETPSGLKGEILGNVPNVWGEREMTVRWENGRIAKYAARADSFKYSKEEPQHESAIDYLESTLNASFDGNRESLVSRVQALDGLVAKASSAIQAGVAFDDERKIHQIVLTAEHEKLEVKEALDHLESADAEAFAPPAPFESQAVEQADLGRSSSWLDDTVDDMIREAESQDFDKLLDEEPGQFVAELETAALADTGITQEMASSHIRSKTAGLAGKDIEDFRTQYLAKVESARKAELVYRADQTKQATQKQAAVEEEIEATDEGLFL